MYGIPFGKFFDANKDYEFIESMELVKSAEPEPGSTIYLFKNSINGRYYAVLEEQHGGDIEERLETLLGNHDWRIEDISPKNPDWYVTHYVAEVIFLRT